MGRAMLDTLGKYEGYSDSGQSWVGDFPSNWRLVRNKAIFKEMTAAVGKRASEYKLLSLTIGGVIPRDMENPKGKFPAEFDTYKVVEPDDLIFCLFDVAETPRAVGRANEAGMITGAYTVLRPRVGNSARFLNYFYLSLDYDKRLGSLYTGLRNVIKIDTFMSIKTPLPDLDTQNRIVDFLDEKTAEIDAAIEKKRRLIDLLNEQKAILINRAVTKGLNPDAPMKDSGVDWIGEIPAHWEVAKVKGVFDLLDNRRIPLSGEIRGRMTERTFDYYGASGIIDQVDNFIFDETTILIAEDGANLVMRNLPLAIIATGKYWVNNHAHILRPRDGDVHYWANALEAADYRPLISGAAQPKLTKDAIKNVFLPRPPSEEQAVISNWLEEVPKHFLPVEEATQREISTLNEFKQTLIANAVTGKIKI